MLLKGQSSEAPALPATRMAWLDAFSAGVARDSGEVCSRLLSPCFRAALEREVHRLCASYYAPWSIMSQGTGSRIDAFRHSSAQFMISCA